MGYKIQYVDRRYQAGLPSKYFRRKGYRAGPPAEERAHPAVTAPGKTYSPSSERDMDTIDYFRRSLGRYYSFKDGDSRATLGNYSYLYLNEEPHQIVDNPGAVPPTDLFAGASIYKVETAPLTEELDSVYPGGYAAANPPHWMAFCSSDMPGQLYETTAGGFPANEDWEFDIGPRPLNAPIPGEDGTYENLFLLPEANVAAPTFRLPPGRQIGEIYLTGNANQWDHIAANSNVEPTFGELFDHPMYNTWKTYVLGSADPRLAGIPQTNSGMPGLLGPIVFGGFMASSMTSAQKAFWDHAFATEGIFPKEGTVQVSCHYNYYNSRMEYPGAGPTMYDSPLLLPNYYGLCSILETETPGNYIYSPAPSIPYGLYSSEASAATMRNIFGYFDAIPLEEPSTGRTIIYAEKVAGAPQNPENYINLFSEYVLGPNSALGLEERDRIKIIMKHVGLSVAAKNTMNAMNSQTHIMPYGLALTISDLPTSEVAQEYSDVAGPSAATPGAGRETTMREAFYDYFLFEIMKANIAAEINDTEWHTGVVGVHGGTAGDLVAGSSPPYKAQLYHTMSMTSWTTQHGMTTDAGEHINKPILGGEAPVFSGNDNYEIAGNDYWQRQYSTTKCIDVRNILLQGIGKVTQNSTDAGTGVHYGLNLGTNGFIGQTPSTPGDTGLGGIAGGYGLMIGRDFTQLPTNPPYNGNVLFGDGFLGLFEGTYLDFLSTLLEVAKFNSSDQSSFQYGENGHPATPPRLQDGATRTIEQLLTGQPAYSDTIAYKITKYEQVAGGGRDHEASKVPIQHIYIPANSQTFEYFDSQVEYGRSYFYEVSAYKLVFGNEYNYYNPQVYPALDIQPYPSRIGEAILEMGSQWAGPDPSSAAYDASIDYSSLMNVNLTDYSTENYLLGSGLVNTSPIPTKTEARAALKHYGIVAGLNQAYHGDAEPSPGNILEYFQASTNLAEGALQSIVGFVQSSDVAVDLGEPGMMSPMTYPDYTTGYPFVLDLECSDEVLRQRVFQSTNLTRPFPPNEGESWSRYVSIRSICSGLNAGCLNPFMIARFISSGDDVTIFSQAPPSLLSGDPSFNVAVRGEGRFLLGERSMISKLTKSQKAHALYLLNILNPNYLTSIFPSYNASTAVLSNESNLAFDVFFGLQYAPVTPGIPQVTSLKFLDGPHGYNPEVPWDLDDAGTATVHMVNKLSLKLIEVPYWTSPTKLVHDLPPAPPDFNFFPTYGVNNKVKILLNQNSNHFEAPPVLIEATDQSKFDQLATVQERTDGMLEYGTDDARLTFEVFRTTRVPSNYVDFGDYKRYALEGRTTTGFRSTNIAIVDEIEPNRAYYYCFRVLDKGGFPSNPTPVMKVELIDESGRMYFISEPFPMVPPPLGKPEKSFRKYLEIGAALDHTLVTHTNPAATTAGLLDELPDCYVGDPADGFWNSSTEKFKVRITSKDTGRKVDLNLRFKLQPMLNPKLPEEN